MSLPQEQIDYIKNYLYPYKFTNNKTIIVNFLTEIYANIYKRCNSVFDSYTFNEVINLPMIISDKIFSALTGEAKQLSLDDFSQGIYEIFFAPIEDKAQFVFDVFDFNKNNYIQKDDVFLILAHFHLIENTTNSIYFLEDVINNFFGSNSSIKREEYINLLSKNADIFVLMIIFINNYTTLIKDSELRQYKESMNYEKFENNNVKIDNYSENSSNNSLFEYQISQKLLKYIQKVKLLDFDEYRAYDSTSEESFDDFEDLNNFEIDMQDCLQSLSKPKELEPKLFSDIQSTKRVNDKFAITLNPHENKLRNSGISIFSKANAYTNNLEMCLDKKGSSSIETSYRNIYQNGNKKEITVYKFKQGKKLDKKIKLVLVNYYIFYFKKSGNSYLFKKIIPIFSLFAKKHTIDNLTLLTFSSTLHNFDKQYSFICENEDDTDKFFQWFNKNIHHKDINEYFSFKCELGKGKFGHVFLAERLKDKKLFAIKIVLKCNPTEEEYKINRWESTIFNCLHNIKNENVIKTIQRYESETKIFFVFEYVKGSDLKTYMKSNEYNQNINSLNNLLNITFQILKGVQCLHKYGIIHRDIKSANIMVSEDYLDDTKGTPKNSVKIVDFGLSRILGKFEFSEDPYGSLCFKAPELIKHMKYNFKVDIWAVGITLFYIIYGELPFEKGGKEEIKNSIISEPVSYYSNNIISDFNYIRDLGEVDGIYNTKSSVLYSIMKDCLEKKQDKRFNIEQLAEKYINKFEW
jgi:hypothetical protein